MPDEEPRAKVFISCGQRSDEEKAIAREIEEALRCEGYDPYVAVEKQTLRDLRHNIFKELEDSEYIVFVDFKREALVPKDADIEKSVGQFLESCRCQWRGSLFCHQELALASYLDLGTDRDMEILAFHQEGVNPQDGMMRALQVNSQEFTDPACLPQRIACHARKKWKTQWKNRLQLTVEPAPNTAKYRHIKVENLHRRKHARNCYGYLKEARNTSPGEEIVFERVELKWALSKVPNIAIFPKSSRRLDAFWLCGSKPGIWLSTYTDAPALFGENIIKKAGTYKLTYVVVSDNFPDAEITCKLEIDDRGDVKDFKETQTNDKDMVGAADAR